MRLAGVCKKAVSPKRCRGLVSDARESLALEKFLGVTYMKQSRLKVYSLMRRLSKSSCSSCSDVPMELRTLGLSKS